MLRHLFADRAFSTPPPYNQATVGRTDSSLNKYLCIFLGPHIFLQSLKLYEVESVRHMAAYSRVMGSKRLCQQKGDAARTDIARNRAISKKVTQHGQT